MYEEIRRFKQLQQISLRQANELGFDVFAEITAFLLPGVVKISQAVKLYNEAVSGDLVENYQEKYYKALCVDLKADFDFQSLVEREQCVAGLCRRFDPQKRENYCENEAAQQRRARAQLESQIELENSAKILEIKQEESKFAAVKAPEQTRPPAAQEEPATRTSQPRRQKDGAKSASTDSVEEMAKIALSGLSEALQTTTRNLGGNVGDLLYCSATELLELQLQLYQMETQLAKQNAHIQAFHLANSEAAQQAAELHRISDEFQLAMQDCGDLPQETRRALMAASLSLQSAERAASRLVSTRVDITHIQQLWKGFEKTRNKDRLFRRAVMGDCEALLQNCRELQKELRESVQGSPLDRRLYDFDQQMTEFLYSAFELPEDSPLLEGARKCSVPDLLPQCE